MNRSLVTVFIIIVVMCGSIYAEEVKAGSAEKVQGVDLVTDAAAAVVTKSFALLSGNLEVKMAVDADRVKNKKKYTENVIGEMVPRLLSRTGVALT
jgi:hypothetical protein